MIRICQKWTKMILNNYIMLAQMIARKTFYWTLNFSDLHRNYLLLIWKLRFLGDVCKTDRPMLSDRCLSSQAAEWIKMPFGMEVGLGPSDIIVLDGDWAPLPKKGCRVWPISIVAKLLDASRCHLVWRTGGRPQPRPHCAHVCCGQTAGWIKMPLGANVCLSPGHFVLHGHPSYPCQRDAAPNFWQMSIVVKWSPISAAAEHLYCIHCCSLFNASENALFAE